MNACPQPDLMAAVRACLDYAKAGLFRSTADVADAMQTKPSRDAVYKWTQTGRLPLAEIPAFELACGANCISEYLAAVSGHVLVKAPVAAGLPQIEFARTQCQVAKAMLATATALVDTTYAQDAVDAITVAINSLVAVRYELSAGAQR